MHEATMAKHSDIKSADDELVAHAAWRMQRKDLGPALSHTENPRDCPACLAES
jgi:hypothetical protein